jgi:hypothetical protein
MEVTIIINERDALSYTIQGWDARIWINVLDAALKRMLWVIIPVSIQVKRKCVLIVTRKYTGI